MDFSKIKWQTATIQHIQQCILNQSLRHVILFIGENETANLLANATANALLCDKKGVNMCGSCPSCIKLKANSHPDKILIEKRKNKVSFGVEEVRDMIAKMYIKPFSANKKIFIFSDASLLTPAAQNALLKVIEEPPAYGMLILCADKEEDLLPTVLSRIPHKFKLSAPTTEEIQHFLSVKYPEKKQICGFCAVFSQGNPLLAEELLLKDGAIDQRKRLCLFLDKLCGSEKSCIFNFCGYLKENADDFAEITGYLLTIIQDILFIKQKIPRLANTDLLPELQSLAQKWSVSALTSMVDGFTELSAALTKSANFEGDVLNFLLEIWEALHDRNRWYQI